MRCHLCPDSERAARGCRKWISDPALRREAQRNERICEVDVEVRDWYWSAVETHAALQSGLLTPDDVSLAEYQLAGEVATARQRAIEFHARARRKRRR